MYILLVTQDRILRFLSKNEDFTLPQLLEHSIMNYIVWVQFFYLEKRKVTLNQFVGQFTLSMT